MTETSYKRALDGAQAVRVFDAGAEDIIMVWHGGTTINIYTSVGGSTLRETTCFSLSDEYGRPPSHTDVIDHMEDHLIETLVDERW